MSTIYIITGVSGEYDAYNEQNICAVHSEERAQVIVEMLNQASKYDQQQTLPIYNQPPETIALMKRLDIEPGSMYGVDYGYNELMIEDGKENE